MSGAKHILFINEFFHPDICASAAVAWDHLVRIARLRPEFRITVIAGRRAWHDSTILYPQTEEIEGLRIVRVNRPLVGRRGLLRRVMGFAVFEQNAVRAARQLDRVDLVIATTAPPQGASIAAKITRERDCPYVYKVLDLYPDLAATLGRVAEGSILHRRWLARDTKLMDRAARVVCIGRQMADRISRLRNINPDKVVTIHDGFDPSRLEDIDPLPGAFRQECHAGGKFVVQYAGNMGLSHPFETIMAAAAALADEDDIQFQFIGGGPQRSYIHAHLPRNGLLIDYQPAERLGQVLSAADVSLISQHAEMYDKALPYKVYGIFAAGRPTIFVGNRRSEIADWVTRYQTGVCVEQGRTDLLISAIRDIKGDPAKAAEMGRAARRLADALLHSRTAAEAWAGLIDRVLDESAPRC